MAKDKEIIVAVSGGFDPIHVGHVRLFKEAKKLGDKLIVILNNDNWLLKKKGVVFIPQQERMEIIQAISYVDEVVLSSHEANPEDMSVCKELEICRPAIFANGGDRIKENIPEIATCQKISCEMIFNVGGGKIQSSSWLLEEYLTHRRAQNI
jgi:cytidyltransferase-like protein